MGQTPISEIDFITTISKRALRCHLTDLEVMTFRKKKPLLDRKKVTR